MSPPETSHAPTGSPGGEPARLGSLLGGRRVILSVGCGGVGKTTTTAALGLAAARRGLRVLCLTIDPARRLAQSLGLEWSSSDARVVDPTLLAKVGVPPQGTLTVMRVDTKATFDGLVRSLAPTPERARRILDNVLYKYISTSLAGTQEYMAMEKLHSLRRDPRFDLILLDTPPTANALDFLDAPERLVGAIDSPAIRWFVEAIEGSGRLSFNLMAKSTAILLKGLSKVTGGGFLEQVAAFITEMNSVFGGWKRRADEVAATLRDPEVGYVLVTTPDPLAIREVTYFAERLLAEKMRPDAFVVNRVHPSFPRTDAEAAAAALRLVSSSDSAARLRAALEAALLDAHGQGRLDRLHLFALETAREESGAPAVFVPTFAADVYDLEALGEIADILAPTSTSAV